jgi:hypothetical protein
MLKNQEKELVFSISYMTKIAADYCIKSESLIRKIRKGHQVTLEESCLCAVRKGIQVLKILKCLSMTSLS